MENVHRQTSDQHAIEHFSSFYLLDSNIDK